MIVAGVRVSSDFVAVMTALAGVAAGMAYLRWFP